MGRIANDETFDEFLEKQGLLAETEAMAIKETLYLLRSSANALRLQGSLAEFDTNGSIAPLKLNQKSQQQ